MKRVGLLDRPVAIHVVLLPLALPLLLLRSHVAFVPLSLSHCRWPVIATLLAVIAWIGLTRLTANARKSAAAVSLLVFWLSSERFLGAVAGQAGAAASLLMACMVLALALFFLLRRSDPREVTVVANVFAVTTTVILLGGVIVSNQANRHVAAYLTPVLNDAPSQTSLPDVYIIVLDGRGRSDVLKDLYGHDDTFVDYLRRRGFYVADRAASNYAQTSLSLASSLNLDYVQVLLQELDLDQYSRRPLAHLIARNRTFRAYREAGYRVVVLPSEYSMIRFQDADETPWQPLQLSDFEYSLYDVSALPALSRWPSLPQAWAAHQLRRHSIRWTLDRLETIVCSPTARPQLVFSHLLIPHPPFVFHPDGSYCASGLPGGMLMATIGARRPRGMPRECTAKRTSET